MTDLVQPTAAQCLALHNGFVPCEASEILTLIEPDCYAFAHPCCYQICFANGAMLIGAGWPAIVHGLYSRCAPHQFRGKLEGAWKRDELFYAASFPEGLRVKMGGQDSDCSSGRYLVLRKDIFNGGDVNRDTPRRLVIQIPDKPLGA